MNKNKNRSWKRGLFLAAVMTMLCGTVAYASPMELPEGLTEEAAGETVSTFIYMTETANGYEKADVESTIVAQFEKDRKLLVVQKVDSEWCKVMEQGKPVYVQLQYTKEVPVDGELAKEMQGLEAERASEVERDIEIRTETKRGRVIGIVIAILIVGIFVTGIIAVIRSGDEEKMDEAADIAIESLEEGDENGE